MAVRGIRAKVRRRSRPLLYNIIGTPPNIYGASRAACPDCTAVPAPAVGNK